MLIHQPCSRSLTTSSLAASSLIEFMGQLEWVYTAKRVFIPGPTSGSASLRSWPPWLPPPPSPTPPTRPPPTTRPTPPPKPTPAPSLRRRATPASTSDVSYGEKEACEAWGGEWDPTYRSCFVPARLDPTPFVERWGERRDLTDRWQRWQIQTAQAEAQYAQADVATTTPAGPASASPASCVCVCDSLTHTHSRPPRLPPPPPPPRPRQRGPEWCGAGCGWASSPCRVFTSSE